MRAKTLADRVTFSVAYVVQPDHTSGFTKAFLLDQTLYPIPRLLKLPGEVQQQAIRVGICVGDDGGYMRYGFNGHQELFIIAFQDDFCFKKRRFRDQAQLAAQAFYVAGKCRDQHVGFSLGFGDMGLRYIQESRQGDLGNPPVSPYIGLPGCDRVLNAASSG